MNCCDEKPTLGRRLLAAYFISLVLFLAIDAVWLYFMTPVFFAKHLAHLVAPQLNWVPALIFYLMFPLSISVFVVLPALKEGGCPVRSFILGAFLGLTAYGAYDLTNHASLRDWPAIVTVVDMSWGAFLTGVVSALTVRLLRKKS